MKSSTRKALGWLAGVVIIGGGVAAVAMAPATVAPRFSEEGAIVVDGEQLRYMLDPRIGGDAQEWRWIIYREGDLGIEVLFSGSDQSVAQQAFDELVQHAKQEGWRFV